MERVALIVATAGLLTGSAMAQCGDVYAGTWRNPPFVFDVYRNGTAFQFTPGVFDAPDQTPIAVDSAGNVYHAQTIDAQGTVRVYRNNVTLYTYSARGGPSWVYSGLALAVEPGGSFHAAFYTAANSARACWHLRPGTTIRAPPLRPKLRPDWDRNRTGARQDWWRQPLWRLQKPRLHHVGGGISSSSSSCREGGPSQV